MRNAEGVSPTTADGSFEETGPHVSTVGRAGLRSRGLRLLLAVPALLLGALLIWRLPMIAGKLDLGLLVSSLRTMPTSRLFFAMATTALSYFALVGYDLSALRYARTRVPLKTVLFTSFCAFAVGNTIGFGALSGGAVRYRLYGMAGLPSGVIARVVLFISGAFGVGLAVITAFGLVFDATDDVGSVLGTSPEPLRWTAAVILMAATALLMFCAVRKAPLRIGRVEPPSTSLVLTQLLLTMVDILAAAGTLWFLLPATGVGFFSFAAIYAIALGLGVVSHIPGGLGVFEVAILYVVGRRLPPHETLAALLAYRGIYFYGPLLLAIVLLAGRELYRVLETEALRGIVRPVGDMLPLVLALVAGAIGVVLVASGALPALVGEFQIFKTALPRSAVGIAHFLGSLAGFAFLIAARGLWRRVDGAWWLAFWVTLLSIPLSLIKELRVFAPTVAMAFFVGLLISRSRFRDMPPVLLQWRHKPFVALCCVTVATVWIFLFAFHDAACAHQLWWQFELNAAAPRGVRMMIGLCAVTLVLGLWQVAGPRAVSIAPATAHDLEHARRIAEAQSRADALLALMGDKSILFSDSGSAFLMFSTQGRSWLSLGDPIGPAQEWPALIYRFIMLADRHGGRAAFYQIPAGSLPVYLDAGLRMLKLGEEARIELPSFSLSGKQRAGLRNTLRRGDRAGLRVEFISAPSVAAILPEIGRVSDAWLRLHSGAVEKGFSVAAFDRRYVTSHPAALLRLGGEVIAFASIMVTGLKEEAAIGLMRYMPDRAPSFAMEYLITRIIERYRDEGYRNLSLGMAPLSGLRTGRLAPRWHFAGCLIVAAGRTFYNFQGLRVFKGKFSPGWQPRYLAARGLFGPYLALLDAAMLIARKKLPLRAPVGRALRRSATAMLVAAAVVGAACHAASALTFDGGSLGQVQLIKPKTSVARAFVVLFSDQDGWTAKDDRAAAALAAEDALVAGVDLPQYLRTLNAAHGSHCHELFGAIDFLSRQLQRRDENRAYLTPIVVGFGEGGPLALAILAQSPPNTIFGAIADDPTVSVQTDAPLCSSPEATKAAGGGFSYGPWSDLPGFATILFSSAANPNGRRYFAALKGAGMPVDIVSLPPGGDGALAAVVQARLEKAATARNKQIIAGLPLIELPAPKRGPLLAVFLSGDGGWRDIDKAVAERLQAEGVSVVGWDCLRYFWNRKSPAETARDLAAVIDAYSRLWHTAKVALIGYSFGADVLPLAYDDLPEEAKAQVVQLSLLGISKKAAFQFSIAGWLGEDPGADALPTAPALSRIAPKLVQCFYGVEDQRESVCPQLADAGTVAVIRMPGGHHFNFDYGAIAQRILAGFRRRAG